MAAPTFCCKNKKTRDVDEEVKTLTQFQFSKNKLFEVII